MSADESRVESARQTVRHNAYVEGHDRGARGERLSLVGVPYDFRMHFARGWLVGAGEYAADVLKKQGEGPHAAFLAATRAYLHSQGSIKRLGLRWPPAG